MAIIVGLLLFFLGVGLYARRFDGRLRLLLLATIVGGVLLLYRS
jgi:hypothetical protein